MTEIDIANQLLKSLTTTSIRIVDRDGRLSLRISIPNQGRKSIALKLRNDLTGLKKALTKSLELDQQIENGLTLEITNRMKERSLSEWIVALEKYYFSIHALTPQSETTWKGEYLKSFKKIEEN